MPLVLKKRGKVWYVSGSAFGKRFFETTGQTRKKDAESYLNSFHSRLIAQAASGETDKTFEDALEEFLVEKPDWGDLRFIRPVLERLHDTPLSDIGNATVRKLRQELYPEASAATVKRQLQTPIKAVMNFAAEEEWCRPVKWRKIEVKDPDPVWLTASQFAEFLTLLDEEYQRLMLFTFGTGMRISEALGLRWRDLSPNRRYVYLPKELAKKDYARTIFVQPFAEQALGKSKGPNERIFPQWSSQRTINPYLGRRHWKMGFPVHVTTHVARHTWATLTYALSKDIHYCMKNGGWADADTMMIYTHYATPDVAEDARNHTWTWEYDDKTATPEAKLTLGG